MVAGWWWCNHNDECHKQDSSSRRHGALQHVPMFATAGSGWKQHCKRHKCDPRCFDDETNPDDGARRKPTDREFIKYTGLLLQGLRGGLDSRQSIVAQYQTSWSKVYPNQSIRLNANGEPEDFSQLAELPTVWPISPSASGSSDHPVTPAPANRPRSAAQDPPPLSSRAAPPSDHPSPSTANPPYTAVRNPPPSHSHQSSPPPTYEPGAGATSTLDDEILLWYLKIHTFPVKTLPMYSQIVGGLVPGFRIGAAAKSRVRVVFVEAPDHRPSSEHDARQAVRPTFLADTEVDRETYMKLKNAVPLSVYKRDEGDEGVEGDEGENGKVLITIGALLLLAIEMMDDPTLWDVTIVDWELYRDTIVTRGLSCVASKKLWLQLGRDTDLIVGGLTYDGDFLNQRTQAYGLSARQGEAFFRNNNFLGGKTTIWVNPKDLLLECMKQETSFLLTLCARSLDLEHPVSLHVKDSDLYALVEEMERGERQGVLKRSHSGNSQHVITPYTKEPTKVLEKALADQKEFWTQGSEVFPKPSWFFQPLMPLLLHLGELRSFVVNGVLYHTAYTTPRGLESPTVIDIMSGHVLRPLRTFGYDHEAPLDPQVTGYLHVDGNDKINPADFLDNMYVEFVLNMVGKLVLAEEKRYNRFSGLRVFVRLDVSVYRHTRTKEYRYVVNEVTRATGTHLFYGQDSDFGTSDHMVSHLVELLHHYAVNKLNDSPPLPPP